MKIPEKLDKMLVIVTRAAELAQYLRDKGLSEEEIEEIMEELEELKKDIEEI